MSSKQKCGRAVPARTGSTNFRATTNANTNSSFEKHATSRRGVAHALLIRFGPGIKQEADDRLHSSLTSFHQRCLTIPANIKGGGISLNQEHRSGSDREREPITQKESWGLTGALRLHQPRRQAEAEQSAHFLLQSLSTAVSSRPCTSAQHWQQSGGQGCKCSCFQQQKNIQALPSSL